MQKPNFKNHMEKVAIYARCSTDESKQDVENQISACKKYCEGQGWFCEVFAEYESAYNGNKRKVFAEVLEKIRLKEFNVLMVYMLDRFSRETPTKIVSDLHRIVEEDRCRFISIKEGIDSRNDMWQLVMMCFAWMANNYSKMLGIRVREGIKRKKEKGEFKGGRPRKEIDIERLVMLGDKLGVINKVTGLYRPRGKRFQPGWRTLAREYNCGMPKKKQISHIQARKRMHGYLMATAK